MPTPMMQMSSILFTSESRSLPSIAAAIRESDSECMPADPDEEDSYTYI